MVEAQEQVPEVKITSLRFTSDKAHCIAANTRGFDVIRMADGVMSSPAPSSLTAFNSQLL